VTLYYLEGTQPTSYCDYHENGENLKRIAVERLQGENYSSGQKPLSVDSGGLTLDPDLFSDPAPKNKNPSPSDDAGGNGAGSPSNQGQSPAPVFNPLLE
jgi:hypothetical protein